MGSNQSAGSRCHPLLVTAVAPKSGQGMEVVRPNRAVLPRGSAAPKRRSQFGRVKMTDWRRDERQGKIGCEGNVVTGLDSSVPWIHDVRLIQKYSPSNIPMSYSVCVQVLLGSQAISCVVLSARWSHDAGLLLPPFESGHCPLRCKTRQFKIVEQS